MRRIYVSPYIVQVVVAVIVYAGVPGVFAASSGSRPWFVELGLVALTLPMFMAFAVAVVVLFDIVLSRVRRFLVVWPPPFTEPLVDPAPVDGVVHWIDGRDAGRRCGSIVSAAGPTRLISLASWWGLFRFEWADPPRYALVRLVPTDDGSSSAVTEDGGDLAAACAAFSERAGSGCAPAA